MEKDLYLKILIYLSEYGIGINVDISEVFIDYHLYPEQTEVMFTRTRFTQHIEPLLNAIKDNGHILYSNKTPITEHTEGRWLEPICIEASITDKGLDYLNNYLLKKATLYNFHWSRYLAVTAILISIYSIRENNRVEAKIKDLQEQILLLRQSIVTRTDHVPIHPVKSESLLVDTLPDTSINK